MKRSWQVFCVLCVAFLWSGGLRLHAEEPAGGVFDPKNFSATFALATDYVFRGISQTDSKPAVQGSFDYKHPVGFYVGIWGSNVDDYVSKGNAELDLYLGFAREVLPNLNCDLSTIYYYYPGGGSDPGPDYFEAHSGVDYTLPDLPLSPKLGVGYNYSPDYYGEDGTGHYVSGRIDLLLPFELTLTGQLGYQRVAGGRITGHGNGENGKGGFDYTHWRVGISRPLAGFTLDLSYHDTDASGFLGEEIADRRLVFGVSRTF